MQDYRQLAELVAASSTALAGAFPCGGWGWRVWFPPLPEQPTQRAPAGVLDGPQPRRDTARRSHPNPEPDQASGDRRPADVHRGEPRAATRAQRRSGAGAGGAGLWALPPPTLARWVARRRRTPSLRTARGAPGVSPSRVDLVTPVILQAAECSGADREAGSRHRGRGGQYWRHGVSVPAIGPVPPAGDPPTGAGRRASRPCPAEGPRRADSGAATDVPAQVRAGVLRHGGGGVLLDRLLDGRASPGDARPRGGARCREAGTDGLVCGLWGIVGRALPRPRRRDRGVVAGLRRRGVLRTGPTTPARGSGKGGSDDASRYEVCTRLDTGLRRT